jgi:CRP-like cAMP-binding protein
MRFESHRKGAVIISEGHKPGSFYFLFSGQCEVMKRRTDGQPGAIRVHNLNSGYASISNDPIPLF